MTPPTEKEDMMNGEKALSLIAQQPVYPISESERPIAFSNGVHSKWCKLDFVLY